MTMLRLALICGACASLGACCDEYTVQTASSFDGATARVISRECGATAGYVTKVVVDSREVLRMSADPRTVSLKWAIDGRTLFVSIPEEVSRRDIFVKEDAAGRRAIKYQRRPTGEDSNNAQH